MRDAERGAAHRRPGGGAISGNGAQQGGPRARSGWRPGAAGARLESTYRRRLLHGLVLAGVVLACVWEAWLGSSDTPRGGATREPGASLGQQSVGWFSPPGNPGRLPLATGTAAETVEAAAPNLEAPVPTALPSAAAAPETESYDDSSDQEPQFTPEPALAAAGQAADALATHGADQQSSGLAPPESQIELASPPSPSVRVTAIGDSVILAAASDLARLVPGIEVDAEVGRPVPAAIDVMRARRDAGSLGDIVLIHIGNNSPLTPDQLDEMMELLAGVRRVVFVNLTVPRDWEGPNNAVLAQGVTRYSNAYLVDWHGASTGHPEYFQDGVHLRPEGARAYAELIAASLGVP
jgi:hypothetical protein